MQIVPKATVIENEALQAVETQVLITDESSQTTRSADDNVGVGLRVLEHGDVILDGNTTVEDTLAREVVEDDPKRWCHCRKVC